MPSGFYPGIVCAPSAGAISKEMLAVYLESTGTKMNLSWRIEAPLSVSSSLSGSGRCAIVDAFRLVEFVRGGCAPPDVVSNSLVTSALPIFPPPPMITLSG